MLPNRQRWVVSDIDTVHVELSNNCNAVCPMCARTAQGGVRYYKKAQISIDQFKQWFPPTFAQKIISWTFCGSQGDPGMCADLCRIAEYCFEANPHSNITISTNGGIRTQAVWAELGKILAPTRSIVHFSIDGLEDTNHLYRKGVSWDKVMENSAAYIAAGGKASWAFLVFEHNEHQVETARAMSVELGFTHFDIKRALGFENYGKVPVYDRSGKFEYYLAAPQKVEFRNYSEILPPCPIYEPNNIEEYLKSDEGWEDRLMVNFESLSEADYLNNADIKKMGSSPITCKSLNLPGQEIFVGPYGIVTPCCYVDTSLNLPVTGLPRIEQMQYLKRKFGLDKFSLFENTLAEIVNNLNTVYADSWDKAHGKCGRQAFCQLHCGEQNPIDRISISKQK